MWRSREQRSRERCRRCALSHRHLGVSPVTFVEPNGGLSLWPPARVGDRHAWRCVGSVRTGVFKARRAGGLQGFG
jgi:hypothetical protein